MNWKYLKLKYIKLLIYKKLNSAVKFSGGEIFWPDHIMPPPEILPGLLSRGHNIQVNVIIVWSQGLTRRYFFVNDPYRNITQYRWYNRHLRGGRFPDGAFFGAFFANLGRIYKTADYKRYSQSTFLHAADRRTGFGVKSVPAVREAPWPQLVLDWYCIGRDSCLRSGRLPDRNWY